MRVTDSYPDTQIFNNQDTEVEFVSTWRQARYRDIIVGRLVNSDIRLVFHRSIQPWARQSIYFHHYMVVLFLAGLSNAYYNKVRFQELKGMMVYCKIINNDLII